MRPPAVRWTEGTAQPSERHYGHQHRIATRVLTQVTGRAGRGPGGRTVRTNFLGKATPQRLVSTLAPTGTESSQFRFQLRQGLDSGFNLVPHLGLELREATE